MEKYEGGKKVSSSICDMGKKGKTTKRGEGRLEEEEEEEEERVKTLTDFSVVTNDVERESPRRSSPASRLASRVSCF